MLFIGTRSQANSAILKDQQIRIVGSAGNKINGVSYTS